MELKPCPFCGSKNVEVVHRQNSKWWFVYCIMCRADGPPDLDESVAIEAWNTRPEVDALQAENARLRAELEQIRTIQAAGKTIEIIIPEGWGEPGIHLPDDNTAHDA